MLTFNRALPLVASLIVAGVVRAQAAPKGVETLGRARFTIITPNLIRLEDSAAKSFVDQPSIFAIKREARYTSYQVKRSGPRLDIDTGAVRLRYTDDGQPFNAANLTAQIRRDKEWVTWTPGAPNRGNLGGPAATLDGVFGPVKLPDGLISRDGWFLLDDSRRPLMTSDWIEARPRDAGTDWYLFSYGRDFRAAFKSLAAISGPVPMPRRNVLGAWYSRYWAYTSDDFRRIVKEYAEHDFPLDNMVLDMDWHRDGWTGWSWNRKLLPDAEKLLQDLHAENLAVTLNLHPADGVGPHEDAYEPFMRAIGVDPTTRQTVPFDIANKRYADALFREVHWPLEKAGVDFWWLDWQQWNGTRGIPELTNLQWLNHLYFKDTSRDGRRGQNFSRWGGWGDHRYPIHFSGDATTDWKMLAFEVPFTSTSSNSGLFFWSHDIGGHAGARYDETYARWCQFGAMTAALRSHSTNRPDLDRRPWTYPAWSEESMRRSFHLRSELFPYIYSTTRQSSAETVPMIRAMYIDYPSEEAAYHNGQQYLFGDSLIVAPIVSPGSGPSRLGSQRVWLPQGKWFDMFTGERYAAGAKGRNVLASADINSFPLFARGGVPIPMQPYTPRMGTSKIGELLVRCYPGEDGQTGRFSLYEDDGLSEKYKSNAFAKTELTYKRNGAVTMVNIAPARGSFAGQLTRRSYSIELPGLEAARSAEVDDRPMPVRYDAVRRCNVVDVPERDIRKGVQVRLRAGLVPDAQVRDAAVRARLSGVLGRPVKSIETALAEVPNGPEVDATAILAALNIGVMTHDDAPYLYGGRESLRWYAPPGAMLRPEFSIGSTSKALTLGQDGELNLNGARAPLPPGEQIVVPGKTIVHALVRYAGREWHLNRSLLQPLAPGAIGSANENLARRATAQASSVDNLAKPENAIDGISGGYSTGQGTEWSSKGEKVGATLTLSWEAPVTVGRVLLYDRPNGNDHVTAARLTFDDGSTVDVGALPNEGQSPAELAFAPRQTRRIKIEITGVGPAAKNSGFSEVAVFPE
jgi:hypothetical protein